jgi:N,N'-diacetyllegionaminate synthase
VQVLISEIDFINKLKGDQNKQPLPVEGDHLTSFRRALYPSRDLPAGTKLTELDLVSMRPNHGISASFYEELLGRTTNQELMKHQKLTLEMFD